MRLSSSIHRYDEIIVNRRVSSSRQSSSCRVRGPRSAVVRVDIFNIHASTYKSVRFAFLKIKLKNKIKLIL